MQFMAAIITIGKWLRNYAVLLILLTIFGYNLGSVYLYGMGPVPQLPPRGYEPERGMVTIQWNRGNIDKPITLEIAKDPSFDDPVISKVVSGTTYNFQREIERDQIYYWRLIQDGKASPVSTFYISKYHVKL
jgi:hypothetical protein